MLVKKLETVYSMNMGSLSSVKSNICLIVFLVSAEQQTPSEALSSSTMLVISKPPAFVDCDMVLQKHHNVNTRSTRKRALFLYHYWNSIMIICKRTIFYAPSPRTCVRIITNTREVHLGVYEKSIGHIIICDNQSNLEKRFSQKHFQVIHEL